jgi:hypothetical protein
LDVRVCFAPFEFDVGVGRHNELYGAEEGVVVLYPYFGCLGHVVDGGYCAKAVGPYGGGIVFSVVQEVKGSCYGQEFHLVGAVGVKSFSVFDPDGRYAGVHPVRVRAGDDYAGVAFM